MKRPVVASSATAALWCCCRVRVAAAAVVAAVAVVVVAVALAFCGRVQHEVQSVLTALFNLSVCLSVFSRAFLPFWLFG